METSKISVISVSGFIFGCGILLIQSKLPSLYLCGTLIFILLIILIKYPYLMTVWLFFFMLGFSYCDFRAHFRFNWNLPNNSIKKISHVCGDISSVPHYFNNSCGFLFSMRSFNGNSVRATIKLSWYQDAPKLKLGQYACMDTKLKPPHSLHNFSGKNYENTILVNGIRASGYVYKSQVQFANNHKISFINRFRQQIITALRNHQSIDPLSGVIAALSTGTRSLITPQQWKIFKDTGTSHLIAISGLHIGFVGFIFYTVFNFFWRFYGKILLKMPSPFVSGMLSFLGAFIYSMAAGFSIPTQRALLMYSIAILFKMSNRLIPISHCILFAFFGIIFLNPFSLFSMSLWLSFFSVSLLVYGTLFYKKNKKIFNFFKMHYVAFVSLIPISLFCFEQLALCSIFANVIAIPYVGFVILPCCILAITLKIFSTSFSNLIFIFCVKILKPLWGFLYWLSSIQNQVWFHHIHGPIILLVSMIAVFLLLAPSSVPWRWLGIAWGLPLFFYPYPTPSKGNVMLTIFDVGQGLAALVQTMHHRLLFDAGPRFQGGFDAGHDVVLPYLRAHGSQALDVLLISHADNDHRGGAAAILHAIKVREVISSFHYMNGSLCSAGKSWYWDNVYFKILSPSKVERYRGNDSSCVLQITAHGRSILLVGDIEKHREKWLLKRYGAKLKADILVAPHHGSATSSTPEFVAAVHPKYVIFAVGFLNRYHFPSLQVVSRYQASGAIPLATDRQGAICIELLSQGRITTKVAYHRHYFWQIR